jgi:hypothetical protein
MASQATVSIVDRRHLKHYLADDLVGSLFPDVLETLHIPPR